MRKIIIILAVAGITFWIVNPGSFEDIAYSQINALQKIIQKKATKTIKTTSKNAQKDLENTSEKLIVQAKENIQDQVSNTTESINTLLENKTQEVLGAVLGKEKQSAPKVEISSEKPDDKKNITKLDFLTQKDIRLVFRKNQTHYIGVSNLPQNFCLFINQSKYALSNDDYVSILFDSSGNYSIHFDYCNNEEKKFGQIVVE